MAVLAYIVRDGRGTINPGVLLIKRGFPPYRGYWSLPGGGTGPDEDPREACVREVKEETGLCVEIIEEIGKARSAAVFSCRIIAGEPRAHPPETVAIAWFLLDDARGYSVLELKVPPFIREFLKEQIK